MGKRADREIAAVLEGSAQVLKFDPFLPMSRAVGLARSRGYHVIHSAQQGSKRGVLMGGDHDRVLIAHDRKSKDFLVMHQERGEKPRRISPGMLKKLLT